MIGWYSHKQFQNVLSNECKGDIKNAEKPYIYYINKNGNIVQVTEVTKEKKYNSKFDDVICIGELKKFHSVSSKPVDMNYAEDP